MLMIEQILSFVVNINLRIITQAFSLFLVFELNLVNFTGKNNFCAVHVNETDRMSFLWVF